MQTSLNLRKDPFVLFLFTTIILLIWFIPLLISSWLVYLTTKKYFHSATATWMHVITTVVSTLLIVSILYIGIKPTQYGSNRQELVGNAIQVLTLLFVVGQIIYVANIGLGILRKRKAS